MNTEIHNVFSYRVKPGMEERFQAYLDKVLPVTEAQEPYILSYEIFRGGDGTYFQHERYENEDAIWKHMALTGSGQADSEMYGIVGQTRPGASKEQIVRDTFVRDALLTLAEGNTDRLWDPVTTTPTTNGIGDMPYDATTHVENVLDIFTGIERP